MFTLNRRRITATSIATLAVASITAVSTASSASAATTCVGAWTTYSTKTLSTSWSYAGSTAKVSGTNYYQLQNYCGLLRYRSVLKLTAAQGTYTKATNGSVRWSHGGSANFGAPPVTVNSPTQAQTTTVRIGFKHSRTGASTSKSMTFS